MTDYNYVYHSIHAAVQLSCVIVLQRAVVRNEV